MKTGLDEAQKWRLRAQQLRELGAFEKNPQITDNLLKLAKEYDATAEALERPAAAVNKALAASPKAAG